MKKGINEDINYMKYLIGYQKGKVISEQKIIISEQTKASYDKIISDLLTTYQPFLTKYGFENLYFMGPDLTDPAKLSTNFGDNKPTVLAFVPNATSLTNAKAIAKEEGRDSKNMLGYVTYNLTNGEFGGDDTYNTLYYLQRGYANSLKLTDEQSKSTARTNLKTDMSSIGKTISPLVTTVSTGGDISKDITNIKTAITKATETTTTASSTTTTAAKTAGTTTAASTTTTAAKTAGTTTTSSFGSMDSKFSEPIVNVTYISDKKKFKIEVFSTFAVMSSDVGSVEDAIIEAIQSKVFTNEEVIKNKDYLTLSFASVRAGATNNYNGQVYADVKFNGKDYKNPIALNEDSPEQINAVNGVKEPPGTRYSDNVTLANKRATNFLSKLKTKLPTAYTVNNSTFKVNISPALKSELKAYSVATGGKVDSDPERDWNKYPVPGQHVYAVLNISLASIPTKKESRACLINSMLKIGYFPNKSTSQQKHQCDYAVFDVYFNDVLFGSVDMGNGGQLSSSGFGDKNTFCESMGLSKSSDGYTKCVNTIGTKKNLSNTVSNGTYGGERYAEFKITNENVDSIVNASTTGEIKVSIKGKDSEYYTSSSGLGLVKFVDDMSMTTHAEVPWVTYYPSEGTTHSKTPTVDSESLAKMARCGGDKLNGNATEKCTKVDLFYINPCEKNSNYAIISKGD